MRLMDRGIHIHDAKSMLLILRVVQDMRFAGHRYGRSTTQLRFSFFLTITKSVLRRDEVCITSWHHCVYLPAWHSFAPVCDQDRILLRSLNRGFSATASTSTLAATRQISDFRNEEDRVLLQLHAGVSTRDIEYLRVITNEENRGLAKLDTSRPPE